MISLVPPSVLGATCALLLVLISHLTWVWARLRRVPGPFLAKFTNLPRAYWVFTRQAHDIHIDLHNKYGKLVRFGPNMVSVQDASEIPNLYRMHNPLLKASFSPKGSIAASTNVGRCA